MFSTVLFAARTQEYNHNNLRESHAARPTQLLPKAHKLCWTPPPGLGKKLARLVSQAGLQGMFFATNIRAAKLVNNHALVAV